MILTSPTRHPLLGDALAIICDGVEVTAMSAVDLEHPTEIPIIAEPAKLPPGVGALLINRIAANATGPLRYAGPYNTPALYNALLRSFRASADEQFFTKDLVTRMATLARDPIPVDFTPAPHVRVDNAHGFAEVRDGVERAFLDGISYRVSKHVAVLQFAGERYADIATFADDGTLLAGPHPIPPIASDVVDKQFPAALVAAILDLVADLVPAPLAADVRDLHAPIFWADLGPRAARIVDDHFEVHAAIWQLASPKGMAHVALAIAEALAPVITQTLLSQLAA
ncbi:MAG: hypothetical protein QM831_14995 [Kofleriaceae bacterium]